jgi:hypothetical protein
MGRDEEAILTRHIRELQWKSSIERLQNDMKRIWRCVKILGVKLEWMMASDWLGTFLPALRFKPWPADDITTNNRDSLVDSSEPDKSSA